MEHLSNRPKYDKTRFGSDLNYFISERCRKDMVVNNVDLIIHDYKGKCIKIIESKNPNEPVRAGQALLLKKLRELIPKIYNGYMVQILIIRGLYPYNDAELTDVQGKVIKKVNQKQLIKFLNNEL